MKKTRSEKSRDTVPLNILNALSDFVSPIYSTDTATSAGHIDCRSEPVIYYSFYLWSFSSAWSTLARSVQFCECKTVVFMQGQGRQLEV
jgi:hypothetical protein